MHLLVNARCTCAARVTVVALLLSVCIGCLSANTLAAASLGSTLRKRFVLIFIIFSRFLTHVFLKKTFHSKVIVSFTYHKLTAIATTLLLRPVDLLLTA